MIDSPEDRRDRLAADAEAYDTALQPGSELQSSTIHSEFETGYPGLAKTVRLLATVFRSSSGSDSPSVVPPQPAPERIGRFRIERFLGSGGFGSVWLGHDPLLRRDVAIKVAHVGVHAGADLQARFQREAHLAARLHHPNIVPVFETDVDNDRLFIVSEYCPGQNLAEWLVERDASIDPVTAAQLVRHLADAAEHAHQQGLIHRDIKPANVLLTSAIASDDQPDDLSIMIPRLTDFGLARDLTAETSSTRTGALVGTAEYMSPEQASGDLKAQRPATDIFSLGVLLYRLLTGGTPFVGQTDFETVQRIISAEPVSPRRNSATIPRDLSSITLKCIEKRPDQRYATAADLRDDLDRFLRGESTIARPIHLVERIARWSKRAPAAATLLFVLILSLASIMLGMGFYLQQVKRHAAEIAGALQETRAERELASQARDEADAARIVAETQHVRADAQRELARETSYRSDMRLAFDLWERRQIHQVKDILQRQQPGEGVDLRGPEWFVLDQEFRAEYREIGKHEGAVTECVLSRDERTLYTTGVDGYVRVWDLNSGEQRNTLNPRIGQIHALALSRDESTIAVGGEPWLLDRSHVVLIEADTGEPRKNLQTHETTVESISFSPDGTWLAAGSRYEPVQLTRLSDGSNFTLPADGRNRIVSFSSDSRLLVITTKQTHEVWRLDVEQPKPVHRYNDLDGHGRTPYLSRFASHLPLLATTHVGDEAISLFGPPEPNPLAIAHRWTNDVAQYSCLSFSPNGRLLIAGTDSGKIFAWHLPSGKLEYAKTNPTTSVLNLHPITASYPHLARVSSVGITNESKLISVGEDGRVALTNPSASGATQIKWSGLQVNGTVIDGTQLLLGCEDGSVREFETDAAIDTTTVLDSELDTLAPPPMPDVMIQGSDPVRAIALSPDRKLVATGTVNGGVNLYRRETGEMIRCLVDGQSNDISVAVRNLTFSTNGQLLAHTGENGLVSVHDIETRDEQISQSVGMGWSVSFLPGNRFVACGGRYEGIRVFDLINEKFMPTAPGQNTTSLKVSPNGQWLASAHLNGTIQITDAMPRSQTRVIPGHLSIVESITFSPDNRSIISLDKSNVIQFTDTQTATIFGRLKLPGGPQNSTGSFHSIQCSDTTLAVVIGYGSSPGSELYLWRLDHSIATPTR